MKLVYVDKTQSNFINADKEVIKERLNRIIDFLNNFPTFNTIKMNVFSYKDSQNQAKIYDKVVVPFGKEEYVGYVVGESDKIVDGVNYREIVEVVGSV